MSAPAPVRGLPAALRWTIGIVIGVVVLNVFLLVLRNAVGGPGGPRSSSYATAPDGAAAYAALLEKKGHPVIPLRGDLAEAEFDHRATLVVLDPEVITPDDARTLRRHVEAGGSLIIGGGDLGWIDPLMEHPAEPSFSGAERARPLAPVRETNGVGTVVTASEGSWEETGGALPVLGTSESTVVAVAAIGTGRAVLLGDTSMLQNRLLGRADNAAFGLAAAGPPPTPVYFAEGVHGYDTQTGLQAIPDRWKWVLVGLTVAALVWMVAIGRRLGPPEDEARVLAPPRRAYVDSLAHTLARTKRRDEVLAPVKAAVRANLARRAGLATDANETEIRRVAEAFGLTAEETRALFNPAQSEAEALAVGRALAKVSGGMQ